MLRNRFNRCFGKNSSRRVVHIIPPAVRLDIFHFLLRRSQASLLRPQPKKDMPCHCRILSLWFQEITATYLKDHYEISPETVWAVRSRTKKYERVALHPENLSYEAQEPARVLPDQLYEEVYGELIEELRYNLTQDAAAPVPVYPFGYDWRQPLEYTEWRLIEFMFEVIERTRLTRHYHADEYSDRLKVNLVGHSMGGLIIAGALENLGEISPVGKVATLATPFQGSFEAVIKMITGTANLGTSAPSSREREAARLTPALYYLLPTVAEGITVDDGSAEDLFDPSLWQPSVVKTIKTYIDAKGLEVEPAEERAQQTFKALLDRGRSHRKRINSFHLEGVGLVAHDWLCVAGVNAMTRVRLHVDGNGPEFRLSSNDRADFWEDDPLSSWTGDGTVPIEGAVPRFLNRNNMVCVRPDDFGYWEVRDRIRMRVGGFHGLMPTMNMLHRLIVRHFMGAADKKGNTWGWRAPGADGWDPPVELKERE